jgi:hypothetical protein
MKRLKVVVGLLSILALAGVGTAQGQCFAGGKEYQVGDIVCLGGFEQQCASAGWSNQQRFCSEDTKFDVIREPPVAVPPAGGPDQGGVPAAPNPPDVMVPQE